MVIYAVRAGVRHRLGMVTSMSTEQLRVRRDLFNTSGALDLFADAIGKGGVFRTGSILVRPGDRVIFTLEEPLSHSHWMVLAAD